MRKTFTCTPTIQVGFVQNGMVLVEFICGFMIFYLHQMNPYNVSLDNLQLQV